MHRIRLVAVVVCAFVVMLLIAPAAQAVILARGAQRNTSAPYGSWGGYLVNSGWQWEGNFGSFLGTPISSKHFITASHIGGWVGQQFTLNGTTYTTTAMYDDPATDLRIWKVDKTFNSYAPIYTGGSDVGQYMVVYGRGTQRGNEVWSTGGLKGWYNGAFDGVKSWGSNYSSGTVWGGSDKGTLLSYAFNKNGGTLDEATLSVGDSGGGVFVHDWDGKWKLAGINYAIDGPFSYWGGSDGGFNASIFDKGGLYTRNGTSWQMNWDTAADQPTNWYATRITSRSSWINSIIAGSLWATPSSVAAPAGSAVPEPGTLSVVGIAAVSMFLRRRR